MEEILMADRRFFAEQNAASDITGSSPNTSKKQEEGWLWKKGGGTSRMGRRSWNQRWCRIERRIMFVYNKESDIHARSVVPLDGAEVRVIDNPKHAFYFEIDHPYSSCTYKVRYFAKRLYFAVCSSVTRRSQPMGAVHQGLGSGSGAPHGQAPNRSCTNHCRHVGGYADICAAGRRRNVSHKEDHDGKGLKRCAQAE